MTQRRDYLYAIFGLATLFCIALMSRYLDGPSDGVMAAGIFSFIGRAVKSVVNVAGKAIGVGGKSDKPIQLITQQSASTDAALNALAESNKALATQNATKSKIPMWAWMAGGAILVIGGGYLIFRRRK